MGCLRIFSVMVVFSVFITNSYANLAVNPGFESGLTPWVADAGAKASVQTSVKNSGTASLKVVRNGVGYQKITGLKSNTSYTLSAFLYGSTAAALKMSAKNFGGTTVTVSGTKSKVFTKATLAFTTGSQTTADIYFEHPNTDYNTYYVDDVELVEDVEETTCNYFIPNTYEVNVVANVGENVGWTMYPEGDGYITPETFRWYRNNVLISGATTATYKFTATANDNGAQFYCIAKAACGTEAKSDILTVTVNGGCLLDLDCSPNLFTKNGGESKDLCINSNTTWTVDADNWINLNGESSGTGVKKFGITVQNNTGIVREGMIRIKSTGCETPDAIRYIKQDGTAVCYVNILCEPDVFVAAGGHAELCIAANTNWVLTTSASWLTLNKVDHNESYTVGVDVSQNTGTQRTATITLKSTKCTLADKYITITQLGTDGDQYLKLDGSTPMYASINMNNNDITNIRNIYIKDNYTSDKLLMYASYGSLHVNGGLKSQGALLGNAFQINGKDFGITALGDIKGAKGNFQGDLVVGGKVQIKDWVIEEVPDYVFSPAYKLRPLDQVETFVKEKSHLPDVPSAQEITDNGVDLKAFNMTLLRKIEELTLYTIELKKQMTNAEKLIEELRNR